MEELSDPIDDAMNTERPAGRLDATRLAEPLKTLRLREPVRADSDARVGDVLGRMREAGVGSCVVEHADGTLVGIFTERDLLDKIPLDGCNLNERPIAQFMQADPETLTPEHPITYALNNMSAGHYRNIPLVDDRDHAVSLVTLRDIVDEVCETFGEEVFCLPPRRRLGIADKREGA